MELREEMSSIFSFTIDEHHWKLERPYETLIYIEPYCPWKKGREPKRCVFVNGKWRIEDNASHWDWSISVSNDLKEKICDFLNSTKLPDPTWSNKQYSSMFNLVIELKKHRSELIKNHELYFYDDGLVIVKLKVPGVSIFVNEDGSYYFENLSESKNFSNVKDVITILESYIKGSETSLKEPKYQELVSKFQKLENRDENLVSTTIDFVKELDVKNIPCPRVVDGKSSFSFRWNFSFWTIDICVVEDPMTKGRIAFSLIYLDPWGPAHTTYFDIGTLVETLEKCFLASKEI